MIIKVPPPQETGVSIDEPGELDEEYQIEQKEKAVDHIMRLDAPVEYYRNLATKFTYS